MVDVTGLKEMLKLHPKGTHFCTTSKESGFTLNSEFLLELISHYEKLQDAVNYHVETCGHGYKHEDLVGNKGN